MSWLCALTINYYYYHHYYYYYFTKITIKITCIKKNCELPLGHESGQVDYYRVKSQFSKAVTTGTALPSGMPLRFLHSLIRKESGNANGGGRKLKYISNTNEDLLAWILWQRDLQPPDYQMHCLGQSLEGESKLQSIEWLALKDYAAPFSHHSSQNITCPEVSNQSTREACRISPASPHHLTRNQHWTLTDWQYKWDPLSKFMFGRNTSFDSGAGMHSMRWAPSTNDDVSKRKGGWLSSLPPWQLEKNFL